MSEKKLQLTAAHLRPLVPVAAIALAAIAAWLAWTGWQQMRDAQRGQALQQTRDLVARGTERALAQQQARLRDRLALPAVQAALAAGELDAAAATMRSEWPRLERLELLPPDLDAAYAGLPKSGFGKLDAAEAALSADAPVSRIIREDKVRLVVAAPARAQGRLVGIVQARLPLGVATATLENATVAGDTYLALRQGGYTIAQRGDVGLTDAAEVLAVPVKNSGLRVAAGEPDETSGAFGLGAIPSFVAAGVLLLLAAGAFLLLRRGFGRDGAVAHPEADAPTLAEALARGLPDETPVPGAAAAPGAAGATPAVPAPAAAADAGAAAAGTGPLPVDPGIFRAYDIRGVVGKTLDAGVAEAIGRAVGSLMHEQGATDIVVGRDGRLSGPDLVAGLVAGLRKAGRNVIDIGMVPTPVVYFGTYHLHTGCGIAVTGSHNPPDYNGFKIMVGGTTLSGDAITALYERIAGNRLHAAEALGNLVQRDIGGDYVNRIASDVQLERPMKVVVDAGNGVAGELGPRVLEAIGAKVEPLYCDIDGTFPNHHPDPSEPHNLEDLVRKVQAGDAELGIAFDGDGDRLGVVTRDGHVVFPDRLLMLFAADVLDRNPGAVVVYDVKCSGRLQGHILRHGGSPLMWKTGHSLIKAKMREVEAELAGEMSGHFFFAERWYGFDDGIYSAARLLEILAASGETPSAQLDALPDGVSTPEIKVDAPGGDPHAFVERFRESAMFDGARASTIDGLRVDWPDGWGLVRASNTTPVL
ncbi:MAG TPA: phosphomannomutase/phosphoglucomutase, partial [Luteimonas sp.]|nr:phosphomannomutase/phosphoglucomutase [Luteimonas sp.]